MRNGNRGLDEDVASNTLRDYTYTCTIATQGIHGSRAVASVVFSSSLKPALARGHFLGACYYCGFPCQGVQGMALGRRWAEAVRGIAAQGEPSLAVRDNTPCRKKYIAGDVLRLRTHTATCGALIRPEQLLACAPEHGR